MQLLGNTDKQKEAYKEALKEAKRARGGSFDIDSFNKEWCSKNGIEYAPAVGRSSVAVSDSKEDKPEALERVAGEIIAGEDIAGGTDDKLRAVVADIVAGIEAYKINDDVVKYSKTKNGTLQFYACLASVCDNVVKPSRILKRAPYSSIGSTGGSSNNNAYNVDMLIRFIDITCRLCAREGLCFNRTLYMGLTGVSSEFLRCAGLGVTSAGYGLWQKVLDAEYSQSLSFAYNSDVGNMRNLNEREAVARQESNAGAQAVNLSELRRLEAH